jgi:hypothetical protein
MLCNSRLSVALPRGPRNSQLDVFVSMGPSWATFEHQKRSRKYGEHNRTIMNNQSKNDQNGRWSLELYSTTKPIIKPFIAIIPVLYRHMWLHRSAHRPSFSTVSGSGCLVMPTPAKAPNPHAFWSCSEYCQPVHSPVGSQWQPKGHCGLRKPQAVAIVWFRGSLKMAFAIPCLVYPLVMTKIAMENGPFIDG